MSNTKDESEGCWKVVALVALSPFLVALNGWALSWLWFWFVSSGFGIRPLGAWEAIGLAMLVSSMAPNGISLIKEEHKESWQMRLGLGVVSPLLAVAMGWAVYHWGMGR